MLFSVDAHTIGCHLTGNEVYIRNLLSEFARLDKDAQFLAYVAKPDAEQYVPRRFLTRHVSENPFVRLGLQIPASVMRERPDLLHVQYTGPLSCPVPTVVTVHDVSYLDYPQYFTRFRAHQLRMTVRRTVARAARILTPSEFSRRAIVAAYGVSPDLVTVVPNGVSPLFRPMQRERAAEWLADQHGIRSPYVLSVGDIQPRKNHVGLIRAFEIAMNACPHLEHRLVLVGKETWYSPEVRRAAQASSVAGRIHFTGWVSDEDLRCFYGGCDLMVFPSYYEGFGLPIMEAMACGRAVVCSNTAAMPEVADSAGLLFDPLSDRDVAQAIQDVLVHPELRQRLERLGLQRSALFNWNRSAERTLEVYYEVAGKRFRLARSERKKTVGIRS